MSIRRTLATVAAALTTAAALAACSSATPPAPASAPASAPAPAAAPGGNAASAYNQTDVTFVQGMVPHHAQAVDMAKMVTQHNGSAKLKDLAGRIEAAQQPEIDQMNGLLQDWNVAASPATDHAAMGHTAGMMSRDQMSQLGRAGGAGFEKMWLSMMIEHHEGAITMSRTELAEGQNPAAKALAQAIIDAQQREITEMRTMLG